MLTKIIRFLSNPDNGDKLVLCTCLLAMVSLAFIQLPGSDAPLLTVNWK